MMAMLPKPRSLRPTSSTPKGNDSCNDCSKLKRRGGFQQIVPPGVLRFLDFARLNLVKGQKHSAMAQGREYVLDIFSGRATVTVETANGQRQVFSNAGTRADVFSGPPVMVY